jgi:hypothetical protein
MISQTGNILVNIGNNDNRFYSKCMLNLDTWEVYKIENHKNCVKC